RGHLFHSVLRVEMARRLLVYLLLVCSRRAGRTIRAVHAGPSLLWPCSPHSLMCHELRGGGLSSPSAQSDAPEPRRCAMDSPVGNSACDLTQLLQGLRHLGRPRQARLFACACCRHFWPPGDPVARTILAGSEGLADGLNSTLLLLALDEAYPLPAEA